MYFYTNPLTGVTYEFLSLLLSSNRFTSSAQAAADLSHLILFPPDFPGPS
jgi:hypothetical protein